MLIDEAVAKLPPVVRIGPYDFHLKHDDTAHMQLEAENRYGTCDTHRLTICIRHNFASPQKVVDTFFHECSHAIFWAYGVGEDDKEERMCNIFGTAMLALHRDNPWLTTWIDECLGRGKETYHGKLL